MVLEDKVARICWNTNHWQRPSGRSGKASNSKAYEAQTGYGCEEWLFDINKLVDGYHYAYIQAIGQYRDKYTGKEFNISFYTIDGSTKNRWWLGEIRNVHVVSGDDSKKIYETYNNNDWLREMYEQLEDVSADLDGFKRIKPEDFFCIRFRPRDMSILEEPMRFNWNDKAVKSDYYNLKRKIGVPAGVVPTDFVFIPSSTKERGKITITYREQAREIDPVHNKIQVAMYEQLMRAHGAENVSLESSTGHGTKIDIVVKNSEGYVFYELKTANSSKKCIREALSQLLEYAYYQSNVSVLKLVVVAPVGLSRDSKAYLNKLRELFKIPIFYQHFDLEQNKLEKEE